MATGVPEFREVAWRACFLGVLFCQQWAALPSILSIILSLAFAILMAHFKYWRIAFFLIGLVYAFISAHDVLSNRLAFELQGKELSLPAMESEREGW